MLPKRPISSQLFQILIISFCTLFFPPVYASTFFEIGTVYKGKPPPMDWWQPGMPTQTTKHDVYLRAGIEKKLTKSLSTRATAQFLGCNDIKALATPDEDHYIQGSGGMCTHGPCKPPDLYQTRGCVGGVGLSGVYRQNMFLLEAGGTFNVQSFDLTASAMYPGSQYYLRGPEAKYTFKDTQSGLGLMGGIGIEKGGLNIGGYIFIHNKSSKFKDHESGESLPSGMRKTYAIAVRYKF